MNKLILSTLFLLTISILFAQSPTDLNSDISASAGFNTVTAIENSFNNARRQEEIQKGLTTNSIKNLDLPDQTTWDGYSDEQKMLFLLNDERTARAGINYGSGAVKGLPFQGVEAQIDGVANTYATLNYTSNRFDHNLNGSPWDRIDNALGTSCRTPISFAENLAIQGQSSASTFPEAVTSAVYNWNYVDASSSWGHRQMSLFQGFTDDNGIVGQEGFIGVGVHRGGAYNNVTDFNFSVAHGAITVLTYYDPVADANAGTCNYNITVTTNSLISCAKPTVMKPSDQTVTVGGMTTEVTFSGTASATYAWMNDNTNTGIPSGGNGNIIAYTTTNAGVSNITVTPTLNGCVGTAQTFKITVNAAANGNCLADVTIMTATFSGDTAASATIQTQNTVVVNGPTTFSAPTVTLKPGFSVPAGQTFTATTTGCTATANGTCAAPFMLSCGQVYSGNNTTNGINTWDTYDNSPDYTGKEVIHTLAIAAGSTVNLDLTGNTQDLALFIYTACDNLNASFLATSDNVGNTAAEFVTIPSSPSSRTVYVIVDGWMGAASTYNLSCTTSFTSPISVSSRNTKSNSPLVLEQGVTLEVNPNPANQFINLNYTTIGKAPIVIDLYNINGQQIKTLLPLQEKLTGQHQLKVDISTVNTGIYFIMLRQAEHIQTRKLVITQ